MKKHLIDSIVFLNYDLNFGKDGHSNEKTPFLREYHYNLGFYTFARYDDLYGKGLTALQIGRDFVDSAEEVVSLAMPIISHVADISPTEELSLRQAIITIATNDIECDANIKSLIDKKKIKLSDIAKIQKTIIKNPESFHFNKCSNKENTKVKVKLKDDSNN